MPFEYFIGTRYLRAKQKQAFISLITLLAIAGVTVGVMALIVVIAVIAATVAMSGTRASELIQASYSLTLPSFIVLFAALYHKDAHRLPGVLTIGTGIGLWLYEIIGTIMASNADGEVLSPGFPAILFGLCVAVYFGSDRIIRLIERGQKD